MRARTIMSILATGTAVALWAALPPASAGAGGPLVPGTVDTTKEGVLSSTGAQRFIAYPHGGSTLLERLATGSGRLLDSTWIHGDYRVPGVTINGDTSGLSENGSSLVLIRPRIGFPQGDTVMVLINPSSLEVQRRIELDGDFSFDAISPDGGTAYLIQYPDPRDPTAYRLRTFDLDTGRLAPGSLLPQNEPDEKMRGFPLRRVSGEGGRWQYTLYDGGTIYRYGSGPVGEPFVHAIDTVGHRTLCIDLGWIPRQSLSRVDLQLSDSGDAVEVVDPVDGLLGSIDTATGEASAATAPAATAPPSASAGGHSTLVVLAIVLAAGLVIGGVARLALSARRRRGGGSHVDAPA